MQNISIDLSNDIGTVEFIHPINDGIGKTQIFTKRGITALLAIAQEKEIANRVEDYPDINTNDKRTSW
jgi:hypothetical protein